MDKDLIYRKVKLLVYGPPGSGKTTLFGTAKGDPRLTPALFLDLEAGDMAIASKITHRALKLVASDGYKPEPDAIDHVSIRDWADLQSAMDVIYNNDTGYKSVMLDSLTEINYLNLKRVLKINKDKGVKGCDGHVPTQPDYMRSATEMRDMIRDLRDLDVHVFLSAQKKRDEDESTGIIETLPNLIGKLAEELPGLVDIVGYISRGKGKAAGRTCLFQPTATILAKDRSEGGKLGEAIDNPTLPQLLDILGEL